MFRSIRTRIVVLFMAAVGVILVAAIVFYVGYTRWHEYGITDDNGLSAAKACAAVAERVGLSELNPDNPDYEVDRTLLRQLCREAGMSYFYVFECDTKNDKITYLVCVGADDDEDKIAREECSYGTVVDYKLTDEELRALNGEDVYEATELDNRFGHFLSWTSAVRAGDRRVLAAADYEVSEQRLRVFYGIVSFVVPLVVVVIVLLFLQLYVLRLRVFDPLRTIAERMRRFSAKDAASFKPLGITTSDEMGQIARAFEGMAADIGTYIEENERLTEQRARTAVELDVARRIQLGIVPTRFEMTGDGFEISAFSRPAREVGGDFYDCIDLGQGKVAVVVGDVSGKGVAAALFMIMVKTSIRNWLMDGFGPADALVAMNLELSSSNPEGMFVTAFIAVLDGATGEVRFANAGHNTPIVAADEVRVLRADQGILLGLFDDVEIVEGALKLGEGDGLVVYTDGVTEAVNAERAFFGEERLVDCIDNVPRPFASELLVDSVVAAVDGFVAEHEQFDDLTVLAIAHSTHKRRVHLVPLDIASFALIRGHIMSCEADESLKRKACLACEEAFVNVVSHSGAEHAWYSVNESDGVLRVTIEDDGVAFDPLAVEPEEKSFEELDEGGMGIGLTRQLADEVAYAREDGHNVLTISVNMRD